MKRKNYVKNIRGNLKEAFENEPTTVLELANEVADVIKNRMAVHGFKLSTAKRRKLAMEILQELKG